MIDPEHQRARELDRQTRERIDPLVDQLTIAARLELLAYVAASVARDGVHELRAMFAEPVPEEVGSVRRLGEPLPAIEATASAVSHYDNTKESKNDGTD